MSIESTYYKLENGSFKTANIAQVLTGFAQNSNCELVIKNSKWQFQNVGPKLLFKVGLEIWGYFKLHIMNYMVRTVATGTNDECASSIIIILSI